MSSSTDVGDRASCRPCCVEPRHRCRPGRRRAARSGSVRPRRPRTTPTTSDATASTVTTPSAARTGAASRGPGRPHGDAGDQHDARHGDVAGRDATPSAEEHDQRHATRHDGRRTSGDTPMAISTRKSPGSSSVNDGLLHSTIWVRAPGGRAGRRGKTAGPGPSGLTAPRRVPIPPQHERPELASRRPRRRAGSRAPGSPSTSRPRGNEPWTLTQHPEHRDQPAGAAGASPRPAG